MGQDGRQNRVVSCRNGHECYYVRKKSKHPAAVSRIRNWESAITNRDILDRDSGRYRRDANVVQSINRPRSQKTLNNFHPPSPTRNHRPATLHFQPRLILRRETSELTLLRPSAQLTTPTLSKIQHTTLAIYSQDTSPLHDPSIVSRFATHSSFSIVFQQRVVS